MYQDFFGLNSKPFGIVPDTRFLFLSDSHKEAIAHLLYALNEKNGFVQLTGEVGVGKTMACRYILANIPKNIEVALIVNPRTDEVGLLRNLCQELNIPYRENQKSNELTQMINRRLLNSHAQGRHIILIIDEAQNLPKRTLEQLRLLTNLETDTQKLLRIILIGQPELGELLASHDMRQVAQRITSRYHLTTLGLAETDEYICHRLNVAGCNRRLFSKSATRKIHKLTAGTPRLINLLCDHSLIGAYSLNKQTVTPSIVKKAAQEALPTVSGELTRRKNNWKPMWLLILLGLVAAYIYKDELRDYISKYKVSGDVAAQNSPSPTPPTLPSPPQNKPVAAKSVAKPQQPVAPKKPATVPPAVKMIEKYPAPVPAELGPKTGIHSPMATTTQEPITASLPKPQRQEEAVTVPVPTPDPQTNTKDTRPAASYPPLSVEQMEAMKREADNDFRFFIPRQAEMKETIAPPGQNDMLSDEVLPELQ